MEKRIAEPKEIICWVFVWIDWSEGGERGLKGGKVEDALLCGHMRIKCCDLLEENGGSKVRASEHGISGNGGSLGTSPLPAFTSGVLVEEQAHCLECPGMAGGGASVSSQPFHDLLCAVLVVSCYEKTQTLL